MSDHLITTRPTGTVCRRCQTVILTGIAEGLSAKVDLTPINPAGELDAILAGRWTYSLTRDGLVHRDAARITGSSLKGPVLPAHACWRPSPAGHLAHSPPPTPVPALSDSDLPPF